MPWLQTRTGKSLDLLNPDSRMVDFENDAGPALARLARFAGATLGPIGYSVAQHSVLGAEAIYAETGSRYLAACFVLHDAHEFVLTDWPTPAVEALDEILGPNWSGVVKHAIRELKHRLDVAIFRAAGIPLPSGSDLAAIKRMDTRMMLAERNALMAKPAALWGCEHIPPADVDPLDLQPWNESEACEAWLSALANFGSVTK